MKRISWFSMVAIIGLCCSQANSQTFGVKGGLNFANMSNKDNEGTYSKDYKINPAYHIGATIDYPFNNLLALESGLLFTVKGMLNDEKTDGSILKMETDLYYLDVPITLKATKDLGAGVKIHGIAGPYIGYGLSGKIKYEGAGMTDVTHINWGNDESNDLRRFDWGLTFGGGFEIRSVIFELSYDVGLANIAADQSNGTTIKNNVLKFSVGYLFGK